MHQDLPYKFAVLAFCLGLSGIYANNVVADRQAAPAKVAQAVAPVETSYDQAESRRLDEMMDRNTATIDPERVMAAIKHVESGGNPHAVSQKGARGAYQTMIATERKPGMGVTPMLHFSRKEQERFARDYFNALLKKYGGNYELALASYNAGTGAVDRVLEKLPKETREYVSKVEKQYAEGEE